MFHLPIVSTVLTFDAHRVGISWPENLAIIFETIQAINFNPSVLQLECDNAGVNNDYQNFVIMMLIGISVGFMCVAVCVLFASQLEKMPRFGGESLKHAYPDFCSALQSNRSKYTDKKSVSLAGKKSSRRCMAICTRCWPFTTLYLCPLRFA